MPLQFDRGGCNLIAQLSLLTAAIEWQLAPPPKLLTLQGACHPKGIFRLKRRPQYVLVRAASSTAASQFAVLDCSGVRNRPLD